MSEQVQDSHGAEGQVDPGAASTTQDAHGASDVVSRQEYEALQAKLAKLTDEAAQRRIAAKEAKQQQERALAEQGEYKALAESLEQSQAELAKELEEARPLAERYRAWEKREQERIASRAKGLSDEDRALLEAVSDLDARARLLDRLLAETKRPAGPSLSAPSSSGFVAPDFQSTNPDEVLRSIRADPDGFRRHVAQSAGGRQPTLVERMMKRPPA